MKYLLPLLLAAALMSGCGKEKSEAPATTETEPTQPQRTGSSNVLLTTGYGAVLVDHPTPHRFDRENWMILINLEGDTATEQLPMVSIADLQAGLVLNVPPGRYKVVSSAWIRKYPPQTGGSAKNILVNANEVVALRARGSGTDLYPYDNTPLELIGRRTWTLQAPGELQDFISEVLEEPVAG